MSILKIVWEGRVSVLCAVSLACGSAAGGGRGSDEPSGPPPVDGAIQKVIDLPDLQPFLHPELAERKPLVLLENGIVRPTLRLTKFGEAVLVKPEADLSASEPVLVLVPRWLDDRRLEVLLRYEVEGVRGMVRLERGSEGWRVAHAEIVEE